jgi:NADH dehydrogenase/NADH:ubiquinone oxidoreductase subunit G
MSKVITLEIDDTEIKAKEGHTILEAAKHAGVEIPTLCFYEGLEPYGACRFCSVEIERGGRTQVVASCCYSVEDGLKVKTKTPKIAKMRKTIIELAAVRSGKDVSGKMLSLANEYNANLSRFKMKTPLPQKKCILCGLCVRRCTEANWESAIGFIGRGIYRRIALFPMPAAGLCSTCHYCADVCPTGRITTGSGPHPPFPRVDDVIAGRE